MRYTLEYGLDITAKCNKINFHFEPTLVLTNSKKSRTQTISRQKQKQEPSPEETKMNINIIKKNTASQNHFYFILYYLCALFSITYALFYVILKKLIKSS